MIKITKKVIMSGVVGVALSATVVATAALATGSNAADTVSHTALLTPAQLKMQSVTQTDSGYTSDAATSSSDTVSQSDGTVSTPSASSPLQGSTSVSNTSSQVTGSGNEQTDIDAENARHENALASINTKYDTQISALQTEIDGFKAEGARDTTAEIEALQSNCDKEQAAYDKVYLHCRNNGGDPDTDPSVQGQYRMYCDAANQLTTQKPILEGLKSDYAKMGEDQSKIGSLIEQRKTDIDSENYLYNLNISSINQKYK